MRHPAAGYGVPSSGNVQRVAAAKGRWPRRLLDHLYLLRHHLLRRRGARELRPSRPVRGLGLSLRSKTVEQLLEPGGGAVAERCAPEVGEREGDDEQPLLSHQGGLPSRVRRRNPHSLLTHSPRSACT